MTTNHEIRSTVREHYKKVADSDGDIGCTPGCCATSAPDQALKMGYSAEELAAAPDGANLGLGCGNPQAIANLKAGETVIDLGSGAGFDCFLASKQVGESGRVIGVDMTAEMIAKARANAGKVDAKNVEFRLGEIEHLPVENDMVDVVISNCVVNLAPDKAAVYRDVFRVLKPGGRVAISDVVATKELPPALKEDVLALAGCVAGAAHADELEKTLAELGFEDIRIDVKQESRAMVAGWFPGTGAEDYVASATIEAKKPGGADCCEPTCCA